MGMLFFPSCKMQAQYAAASGRLAAYLHKTYNLSIAGCCRVDRGKLTQADTAVFICNNCAAILEESSAAGRVVSVWELLDEDQDFRFPDYHGELMFVQDCWTAAEKRSQQDAVRSLLRKMHVHILELEDNYARSTFCGTKLLAPCNKENAALAPQRYVRQGGSMFRSLSAAEQKAYLTDYCRRLGGRRTVCYCKFCVDGIRLGGGAGVHLLELLFPQKA